MAAYAASVALDFPRAERIGNTSMGIVIGLCTLSNYNTTQAEITGITGKFRAGGVLRVVADTSTLGYVPRWNTSSLAFEAYVQGAAAGDPMAEAAVDETVGSFGFIAIGQM